MPLIEVVKTLVTSPVTIGTATAAVTLFGRFKWDTRNGMSYEDFEAENSRLNNPTVNLKLPPKNVK